MELTGTSYKGDVISKRMEGSGKYTFPNGNWYEGGFLDGRFHGHGVMHFPGRGCYTAVWEHGVAKQGTYTFADGLEYCQADWDYCTDQDRRFHSERIHGLLPTGQTKLRDDMRRNIPPGMYDVGDGVCSPASGRVHDATGRVIRTVGSVDKAQATTGWAADQAAETSAWVRSNCSVGM